MYSPNSLTKHLKKPGSFSKTKNNKNEFNSFKILKSKEEMFSTDGAVTKNEDLSLNNL